MCNALLDCELVVIHFRVVPSRLIDVVVFFCHALLIISMQCGLLVGEFSEFLCFQVKPLGLLVLCFVFPCFIN